ncbi:hypothetical protein LTR35_015600 [Friedmanniomyces endolithicus]|uniref:Uncharacterized protein n=1 Tax=Friedmanniomyces endolithicus TaxID=329885 RepID=A0AAN6F827_9PEZI|nr:hypothetical protein LTR35_015600 [Friedmanniomyces endolithicus]KAK0276163.1 hypothetical protein LTS00_014716 [Friedmanniomyces endolithicus]KAK0309082.1 hypothetical protein LTR82_015368 [Friedmanniomyces endolithicus]KAK0980515.1 hypothetical protein LTR54_015327 [Friedmanniomyces endolithicus]
MANHTSTASEANETAPGNTAALSYAPSRRHASAAAAYRYVASEPPSASDVPALVSSASSTSSETSGSVNFASERAFDDSASERMRVQPNSPRPPPFNGSTTNYGPRRATANRRRAPSTLGSGGSFYAHAGGLYSSPPDAADYAHGDDLIADQARPLADQARPSAPVQSRSPATLLPDTILQAAGVRNNRHPKQTKPTMARWLDDDADHLPYWLSYGGPQ